MAVGSTTVDMRPFLWPEGSLSHRFSTSTFGGLFLSGALDESIGTVATGSRWPAFFPSPVCILTLGGESGPHGAYGRADYSCVHNRALALARRLLQKVESPTTDRLLSSIARAIYGASLDRTLVAERVPYAYVLPLRYDDDLATIAEQFGLCNMANAPAPHVSFAQMKHRLRVMKRRADPLGPTVS